MTHKIILLTSKAEVLVDEDDYEYLNTIRWSENWHSLSYTSYAHARLDKTLPPVYMHRLIMKAEKGLIVDHINHNGLDNRKSNLRVVDRTANMYNRRSTTQSSQYYGVFKEKGRNRYRAAVKDPLLGRIYLGSFHYELNAAKAYNEYVIKFNLTSCPLNKIDI